MPDGYRRRRTTALEALCVCVVIAGVAVLIFATGRSFGVDAGRDEVSARQHYEQAKDGAVAACIDTEPTALRQCMIEAVETGQDQSESRQDLYAQQDMSKWAFWMMVTSALMFLVSGLGVVWIRDTLVETRRAVRAADDAVGVTRDIAEKQGRAYVGLSEIDQGSVVEAINARDGRDIEFSMKNFGQTPARNFRFLAFYNIHPKIAHPQEEDFIKAGDVERPPNDTLQIGADAAGAARAHNDLTESDYLAALDPLDPAQLHIIGVITYTDVFGNEQKTRFGFYTLLEIKDLDDGRHSVSPSFVSLGFHNDAT